MLQPDNDVLTPSPKPLAGVTSDCTDVYVVCFGVLVVSVHIACKLAGCSFRCEWAHTQGLLLQHQCGGEAVTAAQ